MAKKPKYRQNENPADKYIQSLNLKQLKRECVIRGLHFELVISESIPGLSNWFREHFGEKIDYNRLNEFDLWVESKLRAELGGSEENIEPYFHPALRLGYIAEQDKHGNVIKRKRARTLVKKKKKKRERTKDNIFSGTKKALTYELQKKGLTKIEVTQKVIETFPDASEKSISIWFNKAKKLKS